MPSSPAPRGPQWKQAFGLYRVILNYLCVTQSAVSFKINKIKINKSLAYLWCGSLCPLPLAGLQEGRDGGYPLLQLALLRRRLLQLGGQAAHMTGPLLQLRLQAGQALLELCGHRT